VPGLVGQRQGVQHPFGRVEVRDDPVRDGNRLRRHAERLWIEPEIDDQLLGRPGDPAEVGVGRHRLRIVDLDLHPLLRLLRRVLGGWLLSSRGRRGGRFVFFLGLLGRLGHKILLRLDLDLCDSYSKTWRFRDDTLNPDRRCEVTSQLEAMQRGIYYTSIYHTRTGATVLARPIAAIDLAGGGPASVAIAVAASVQGGDRLGQFA